jgi:hypothetical protein
MGFWATQRGARLKPYCMRVAERLKKAIEVDPTRAVVDTARFSEKRKTKRRATAVFAARWTGLQF